MNSIQDSDTRIKLLEMHVAQLERNMTVLEDELDQIKSYLLRIVSHQTALTEKVKQWPYVVINNNKSSERGNES